MCTRQSGLRRRLHRTVLVALLGLLCTGTSQAQSDEIDAEFQLLDAARTQQLRRKLDEPVSHDLPADQMAQQFWEREAAAQLLGEPRKREAILREAIALLPDPSFKRNLGQLINLDGRFEEGNSLLRQAIKDGNGPEAAFGTATLVCELFHQNKDAEARATAREADRRIANVKARVREVPGQIKLLRAAARRDNCMSMLEERVGHYAQAIEFARSGEQWARMALPLYTQAPNASMQGGILADIVSLMDRKLNANIAADKLADAEAALREYLRFSKEYQLQARFLALVNADAATLRFSQREFGQAERFARKNDEVLSGMGLAPLSRLRINGLRSLLGALIGQKKWPEALALLDKADAAASGDTDLQQRSRFAQQRGLVYLHTQRYAAAIRLFEGAATQSRTLNGERHFLTAQNTGLQGVALWRSGVADNQVRALPLLKAAVRDYMAPANADFSEAIGLRREIRELVFEAYLDAASRSGTDEALAALAPADWARGGVVKDALNDAAVRAAASTPAMADLVRREQDARNEITGLRRYLAGELGGTESPLPQVATQMRERIAALEQERAALQTEVKARFPDYDRLIHPAAAGVKDIAQQLAADQALVLLMPVTDAVYVWAIAKDTPAQFLRAQLNSQSVADMVKALRSQLDFGTSLQAGKRFDSNTAFTLYEQLLAPLDTVLKTKTQLVVAAGGALSQLPFALLQTEAGAGFESTAPWLIKRSSVTQIPSLSGWLAIKSLAATKAAPEAFAGWGDPVFDAKALAAAPQAATNSTRSVLLTRAKGSSVDIADLSPAQQSIQYNRIPTLPETRDELLAIAATLQSNPTSDLLLGAQATRDSVLQASASGQLAHKRVIAFATHGLMAGDLPGLNQPALALAATGREEQAPLSPLLTLEDVLTLKLNADWVVLSACNSAAEDGRGDEAMSGLARGFFYAGSRALLVTHWAVESESAKLLTTATFAHYAANPKAPKAESLRQAMLDVMAKPQFRHPAFWAPYALVGDGGR